MTTITELPEDILLQILGNLAPQSYLNFCSVRRQFYQVYNHHPSYWRIQTARKFRLPISPLLHADGERWFWLYKKLKTQTRLYTWGQGVKGNLGPARSLPNPRLIHGPPQIGRRRIIHQRTQSQWPTETDLPEALGNIVDLQCGGWSTTVLTSDGHAFTLGILDSANQMNVGRTVEDFTRLTYLSQSTSALRQISVGRRHVLAIDDDGEILTWDRVDSHGYKVFARAGRDFGGKPRRVVAGWGDSSAYIPETGIVYWQPIKNDQEDQMLDGLHVKERTIPNTARRLERISEKDVVVEVLTHIVLEGYIVWITSRNQIFACAIDTSDPAQMEPIVAPFEVSGYASGNWLIKDIQGSFRSFAVFTDSGDVLAGNVDYLRRCLAHRLQVASGEAPEASDGALQTLLDSRPADIPALQHTNVIQLAFGDHHYHALHSNGTITSYGTESQCCGSLGFGDIQAGSFFRGVHMFRAGFGSDAQLLPIADLKGRQVWFEPEKKDWLRWLQDRRLDNGQNVNQSLYSEWVEQEGRHWAEGPLSPRTSLPIWGSGADESVAVPAPDTQDYDNLGAYFAITVAAAGWHSGALVLVDEHKAEEARQKWIVRKPAPQIPGEFEASEEMHEDYVWEGQKLPKIQLPAGVEQMVGGTRPWRDGVPTLRELGLNPTPDGQAE